MFLVCPDGMQQNQAMKKIVWKRYWLVVTVLSLLSSLVLAANPQAIERGASIDPPSLDPNRGSGTPASPVLSDLVEGLVVRGAAGQPVPGCAESWRLSDDRLTYTFTLRPGLRWSDGRSLTADDFVYSFRRLLDPATGARSAGLFFLIDGAVPVARGQQPPESLGVSAPDQRTVEIRLTQPAPYFIQLLANSQGTPVPRHVIEKHGRDWTKAGIMVSNGAYKLVERIPQVRMRMVKNEYFHAADSVSIAEVNWRPVQDLGSAFRQFRAGELDTILLAPPDQLDWIRANMPDALHVNPVQANYHLVFNLSRAPVDDLRVRQALTLAVDHDAIANQVLQGSSRPARSLITPGTGGYPGYTPVALQASMATRQAQARELLAAAGYGPERPLELSLTYDSQEENRKIMVALAAMWRTIGVQLELEDIEGRALFGRLRGGDFTVARSGIFALFDDAYAFLQRYRSDSTDNQPGFRSAAFDELLNRANAETDAAVRMDLLVQAETLLLETQPILPIYWYVSKVLVAPRVQGWIDAPLGTPPSRYLSLSN